MKRTILISLFAVFLAGCGSGSIAVLVDKTPQVIFPDREFVPKWDNGYKVGQETDAVHLSTQDMATIGAGVSGAAASALPAMALPAFGAATAGIGAVVAGAVYFSCPLTDCLTHEPYGDILMSGNVLRGVVFYNSVKGRNDPSLSDINHYQRYSEYRIFKNPENISAVAFPRPNIWTGAEWGDNSLYEESLGLQGGDLVDVYYPHNPNLEREAIAKKLIYSGTIVRIVCKYDDDDCFDKYARNDDNFILGRWKTLEEYKAEYTTTGGFPNTETPTTATSE